MDPVPNVLSERTAAQLLARASELDHVRGAGVTVADLRVAATEAGIAVPAFDAALAEVQRQLPVHAGRIPGGRIVTAAAVVAVLVGAATLAVMARGAPSGPASVATAPFRDEAIVLHCLTPAEAAEIIRPLLTLPANLVLVRPTEASRVLTLRATAKQLSQVKERLAPYEVGGSPTCTTRSAR